MAVNSVVAGNNAAHSAQIAGQKSKHAEASAPQTRSSVNNTRGTAGGNEKVTLSSRTSAGAAKAAAASNTGNRTVAAASRSNSAGNGTAVAYNENRAGANNSTVGKTINKLV